MKITFAVCLCLVPFLALSQKFKPLDSLTLIKFGSSKSIVVETIKAARGVWDVQYSRPQYYVFSHLKFDNKSKSLFIVKFTAGKRMKLITLLILLQALMSLAIIAGSFKR